MRLLRLRRRWLDWPGARQGLRVCEPEGRRRQDDDGDQSRGVPRRGGRARARRRPRPAGERDLGARDARERHVDATTCSTARRSRSSRSRRSSRTSSSSRRSPSSRAPRSSSSQRDDGERYLAEALQHAEGFDFVLLDCPPSLGPLTVNALAAADRVIVPVQTEYYALEGLAQLVQSINLIKTRLNPTLDDRGRAADDGRRAHAALGRRRGGGAQALRRRSCSTPSCRARCASPRRRATACP